MPIRNLLKNFLPLLFFIGLAVFLAIGLTKNPRLVPSPFIGKQAPAFNAQRLYHNETISEAVFINKDKGYKLLNVWASWCPECWGEHAFLMQLAESGIEIIGLNYKDEDPNAKAMLKKSGNPFTQIAVDTDGKIGINYGVYGAPETFIINSQGIILYKHIGPLDINTWKAKLLPVIQGYINENS